MGRGLGSGGGAVGGGGAGLMDDPSRASSGVPCTVTKDLGGRLDWKGRGMGEGVGAGVGGVVGAVSSVGVNEEDVAPRHVEMRADS